MKGTAGEMVQNVPDAAARVCRHFYTACASWSLANQNARPNGFGLRRGGREETPDIWNSEAERKQKTPTSRTASPEPVHHSGKPKLFHWVTNSDLFKHSSGSPREAVRLFQHRFVRVRTVCFRPRGGCPAPKVRAAESCTAFLGETAT